MRKILATSLLATSLFVLLAVSGTAARQNANTPTNSTPPNSKGSINSNTAGKARPPIFRATKEQVRQAQTLLRQRGLYAGDATGKLDEATRAALRKFQTAESLKATGTLNASTLERMNIPLTDRQKATRQAATK